MKGFLIKAIAFAITFSISGVFGFGFWATVGIAVVLLFVGDFVEAYLERHEKSSS